MGERGICEGSDRLYRHGVTKMCRPLLCARGACTSVTATLEGGDGGDGLCVCIDSVTKIILLVCVCVYVCLCVCICVCV